MPGHSQFTLLKQRRFLPCLLFSAHAGRIAEKLEKQKLSVITTTMEIAIMSLAAAGFLLHSLPVPCEKLSGRIIAQAVVVTMLTRHFAGACRGCFSRWQPAPLP